MIVTEYKTLNDFRRATHTLFSISEGMRVEHENVLILRILQGIADGHYADYRLFCIHQGDAPVLAAVMTPPHNLAFSQGTKDALQSMIDYTRSKAVEFPGINGPTHLADAFASRWNATSEQTLLPAIKLPFYVATHVAPYVKAPGHLRLAAPDDAALLTRWQADFAEEAGLAPYDRAPKPEKINRRIHESQLMIWENENDIPVCFLGYSPATKNGMAVGPVYTPPEHRGHGYATGAVSELTNQILKAGKWCGLFADAKNPTSNKIYQKIGYNQVFEYQEYRF